MKPLENISSPDEGERHSFSQRLIHKLRRVSSFGLGGAVIAGVIESFFSSLLSVSLWHGYDWHGFDWRLLGLGLGAFVGILAWMAGKI